MPATNTPSADGQVELGTLWLKRVLLPFWIFRLVFMKLYLIIYIVAIIAFSRTTDRHGEEIAVSVVLLVVTLACIVLDYITIFMFIRRRLKPLIMLVYNSIETTIWSVLFALQVYFNVRRYRSGGNGGSAIAWLISFLVLLSYIGLLIYVIVVYVRYRKLTRRGRYAPAGSASAATDAQNEPVSEAYDTPMQLQYPGGGGYEYYRPQKQQGGQQGQGQYRQDHGQYQQGVSQQGNTAYRTTDFAAAADRLTMDQQRGGYYGPGGSAAAPYPNTAGQRSKAPGVDIAEQPLEYGSRIP